MSTLPLPPAEGGPRYPGFDVMTQAGHWDEVTRAVITERVDRLPDIRFFTPAEHAVAGALLDRLMGQHDREGDARIDIVALLDDRLNRRDGDGWHYDTMPPDPQAWRDTLASLDQDAQDRFAMTFSQCDEHQQRTVIEGVRTSDQDEWHGMPRSAVWSLWTRYAASAFYSHPQLWNEIGFDGPAYPRGYKNLGVDRLESFEVSDANPTDMPRGSASAS